MMSFGSYDANGNQITTLNGLGIGYDAENRVTAQNNSHYSYNGSNQRVWEMTGSTEAFVFYGLQGERLATFNPQITTDELGPEMSLTLAEVDRYFGSKLVYRKLASGTQGMVLQDRLGSARVDSLTSPSWTAYYPYGQERGSGTANDRMKFGTYRRDTDTGLDYAMNRYYLSNWGRFVSPDPYTNSAELANPRSWNRYAYVNGDPVNYADSAGLDENYAGFDNTGVCPAEFGNCPTQSMMIGSCWPAGLILAFGEGPSGPCNSGPDGPVAAINNGNTHPEIICPLEAPTGNYTVASGVVALFAPDMAADIDAAFAVLNQEGIVPMITSGFRTAAGQAAQQSERTCGYDSQRRPSRRLCARAPVTWMMRLIIISTTLLLGLAFAQRGADLNTGTKVYFLNDDSHKQWCGYASESRLKTQIQTLRAMIVEEVDYKNDRVYAIHITEVDETGDWAVNDEYTLDESETIRSLKRKINIIPEDNSEEQLFLIKNGKAIKQSSTHRELRTGKPTKSKVNWFEAPPVITEIKAFPFATLITKKPSSVVDWGGLCSRTRSIEMLSPVAQQYLYSGRQNNGQLHLRWLREADAAERDGGFGAVDVTNGESGEQSGERCGGLRRERESGHRLERPEHCL